MIDRELLDKVTQVVTHANCPDGVASAILLHDALIDVPITFHAHGSPDFENLEAKNGLLFCDMTPPPKRVQEFVDVGALVLDHHAKQRDVVEAFGARGIYADLEKEPGVSGAPLAFREVWRWSTTEGSESWARAADFAMLAGIRDTWQTKHARWNEARAQAEALRFYPWSSFERVRDPFGSGYKELHALLSIGPILVERSDADVLRIVEHATGKRSTKGTHVMVVATTHTSDVAEAVQDVADVVIGFAYEGGGAEGQIWLQLSMRSRGDYDVGAFCKSLGGGGHVKAAGARIPVTRGSLNPYETIFALVETFENQDAE